MRPWLFRRLWSPRIRHCLIIAGLSKRLSIVEDGGREALVVQEALEPQDVVVALDPYVAVG